jgi:hypothetical protein
MEFAHEGIMEPGTHSREAYADLAGAMGLTSSTPPSSMMPQGGSRGYTITPCDGSQPPGLAKLAQRRAGTTPGATMEKRGEMSESYVPGNGGFGLRQSKDAPKKASRAKQADDWAKQLLEKRGASVPSPLVTGQRNGNGNGSERDGDWGDLDALNGKSGPALKTAADTSFADALEHANPVKLAIILMKNYQKRWLEWEPETLWKELGEKAGSEISQKVRDKIQAMRVTLSTTRYFNEWPVFEKVTVAFNGREPKFKILQHVSPEEISRSVTWARQLDEQEFSAEVLAYIAAVCQMEGVLCLPEPLTAAQPFLDAITSDRGLCPAVKAAWEQVKNVPIDDLDLDGGAVSIQLIKMISIARAADPSLLIQTA